LIAFVTGTRELTVRPRFPAVKSATKPASVDLKKEEMLLEISAYPWQP
jgi:hypothetical protein